MNAIPVLLAALLAPFGVAGAPWDPPYADPPARERDGDPHPAAVYPAYGDGYAGGGYEPPGGAYGPLYGGYGQPDGGYGQRGPYGPGSGLHERPAAGPDEWGLEVTRDGRSWVSVPPRQGGGPGQRLGPADPYAGYGPPSGGLYEYFQFPDRRGAGARGAEWPAGARGAERRYRFRPEAGDDVDAARGEVWHRGYRFRPLTGQEIERGGTRPGWRPIEAPRDAPAPAYEPPATEGAYGYRPDDWFERFLDGGAGW